jgi:molybdopterin/thiamine biosynthesis adenylyltransferase
MLPYKTPNKGQKVEFRPLIFDINNSTQKKELESLLKDTEAIQVFDEISSQLRELIKIRNPKQILTESDYTESLRTFEMDGSFDHIGNWVYYPWSQRLVHLLGKDEFIELRTSRNLYKITPEERSILQQKAIGVIGLSVGQMIAITMVMERICAEIRLADFDALELSNMNRIRTSLSNLGIPKVIIAAREIAEIDPYIEVKIFKEGITEDNIDLFLLEGGKLDVLVEECDGLDVKILSRVRARAMGIPVVMETNDRGMIDIERFDLNPSLPLLHGLIPENMQNLESLRNLSNQEKVPLLGAMVGIDKISERMKLSLAEMGKTIGTWPQLASSVVLGGAMVTDVCRKILLQQLQITGRFYVDFDQIIK